MTPRPVKLGSEEFRLRGGPRSGKGWCTIPRLYGPLEPWFDESWRPSEIEVVNQASELAPARRPRAESPSSPPARSSPAEGSGTTFDVSESALGPVPHDHA